MLRHPLMMLSLAALGCAAPAFAQDTSSDSPPAGRAAVPVQRGAFVSEAVTPHSFDGDLRHLPRAAAWQPGDPIKEIPRRRRAVAGLDSLAALPERLHFDPLLDQQLEAEGQLTDPTFGTPLLNFTAQGFSGATPPDPSGDVGGDYFIQTINSSAGGRFVIYEKTTGTITAGPTALETLGTGNCASGLGDAVVLYDNLASRWLLTEFSGVANSLCVYVSKTSNPVTGGWWAYEFTTPTFPDYPKYGVWSDAYYVGANEDSPSLIALDRTKMLSGLAATMQRFTAPTTLSAFSFQMLAPVDHDGKLPPPPGSPGLFLRHNDDEAHSTPDVPGADSLELFEFHVDWTTPANSTLTGPIAIAMAEISSNFCGFTTFSCIPQPGTANLDPLREVVMNKPAYRNRRGTEIIVGSLPTNVAATPASTTNAGVRWFELRKTTGSYGLRQQGTLASPPCTGVCDFPQRWMSSTVMDAAGGIATAYNFASDTTNHPGLRYSGRLASDPQGTLPQGEGLIVAGTASSSSNRYGDYNQLNVDDSGNGCTFFYTGEWNPAASWSTRIASFEFAACTTGSPVFSDGFELGSTAGWSLTLP